MADESEAYEQARSEHARILTAYQDALKAGDVSASARFFSEGEVVWQRVCDLAPDEESRSEVNRTMHQVLAFSAAVALDARDEARRLYEAMPAAHREAVDAYEARDPGSMKIWLERVP